MCYSIFVQTHINPKNPPYIRKAHLLPNTLRPVAYLIPHPRFNLLASFHLQVLAPCTAALDRGQCKIILVPGFLFAECEPRSHPPRLCEHITHARLSPFPYSDSHRRYREGFACSIRASSPQAPCKGTLTGKAFYFLW